MARGKFITFEGGEGSGKSTQARLLADHIAAKGIEVVVTREPGGSPLAEKIRALLLQAETSRFNPLAETLLFYAARADHLAVTIRPALAAGRWVICDRFNDSTRAYQGAMIGVLESRRPDELTDLATESAHPDPALVMKSMLDELDAIVVGATRPDLTLLLDLAPKLGLARAEARRRAANNAGPDTFEGRDLDFHRRVRELYLSLARSHPDRIVVIDAGAEPDSVRERIWSLVSERMPAGAP